MIILIWGLKQDQKSLHISESFENLLLLSF